MGRVISVAMQKGGVGKTTTTINLAAALARIGQRVLVVDLDPQGNLTQHAGLDPERISPTIYDILRAEVDGRDSDVSTAIYPAKEGFSILPSQPELSLVELALMNTISRERVLSTVLEEVRDDYDYTLIDCSPSLSLLVINALTASDSVLIPIQTEYLAARGAYMVLSTIETVRRKRLNPGLQIEGILLTMADVRTTMTREIIQAVEEQFGEGHHIFSTVVRRSVRFVESAAAGTSILSFAPRSPGAEAYKLVAQELVDNNSKEPVTNEQ